MTNRKIHASTSVEPIAVNENEWGLPDWIDETSYGEWKRWSFWRWRWEFYRRRNELRQDFLYVSKSDLKLFGKDDFRYKERPEKGKPGHFVYVSVHREVHEYLGYKWKLPDPSVSNHPEALIRDDLPPGVGEDHWKSGDFPGDTMDLLRESFSEEDLENAVIVDCILRSRQTVPMPAGPERAIISFDLTKPLAELIPRATQFLKYAQKEAIGHIVPTKRRHPRKWLGYLRTLDAREEGATWGEISVLHPNTAQTEQTARDIWKAANALRYSF